MNMPWDLSMVALAGFAALTAATQAQGMSIQELFNDKVISDSTRITAYAALEN
jgi:hypothetical protein